MDYDGDDPSCLVGEQLNAVAFVMDYVEFKFNAVEITDDDRIELRLNGDRRLTIPLDRESRVGAEAAHFVPAGADGSLRTPDMLIW